MYKDKVICYYTYCKSFVDSRHYPAYLRSFDDHLHGGIGIGSGHRFFGKEHDKFESDILKTKLAEKYRSVITRFEKDLSPNSITVQLFNSTSIRNKRMPNYDSLPEGLWWFEWAGNIYRYNEGKFTGSEEITQAQGFKINQVLSEILYVMN